MAVQVERPWEFMAKGLDFGLGLMIGENRQLVTNEPIEFEK
jgi:hypothetical protein